MEFLPLPFSPFHLLSVLWRRFLPWYFLSQPRRILRMYGEYAGVSLEIFSFVFLLKTLFAPWKGIADAYPPSPLHLVRLVQAFTLNCTARAVGCVVRFFTILLGLAIQILLFLVFAAAFVFWIAFPAIAFAGVELLRFVTIPAV